MSLAALTGPVDVSVLAPAAGRSKFGLGRVPVGVMDLLAVPPIRSGLCSSRPLHWRRWPRMEGR